MSRTLIVDGTNLFIRSYSVDSTLDSNGTPIGGVGGTLKSLRLIIKSICPDKVIFVWDGPNGSLQKRRLFKEYKKGRRPRNIVGRHYAFKDEEEAKKNKIWQINLLQKIIQYLPICQIITEDIEADDAIGYIIHNSEFFEHHSNIIATCDKDFYQLVNKKTVIYNPIKKNILTSKIILENTGFHPNNWLFFKSINGDNSDNINGVKGFGEKTIAKLFPVEKENIILNPKIIQKFLKTEKDNKKKLRYQKLYDNIEIIYRNWKLMSLHDLLISEYVMNKISYQINNFKPTLNRAKFYVVLSRLGGLNIVGNYLGEFHKLETKWNLKKKK